MEDYSEIVVDAVSIPNKYINTKNRSHDLLNSILDHFTIDDYKSLLFLLIDKLQSIDMYLYLINQDETALKNFVLEMKLDEKILIELFETLKMYKELKSFKTCSRVYKMRYQDFNKIKKLWKFLFTLCEEISDEDLSTLRNHDDIPDDVQNRIGSAEEFFAYSLKYEIIKKDDVSKLKHMFKQNYKCLNIIDSYQNPELDKYDIRDPCSESPCGIALILNFESFTESYLTKREGSAVDVELLERMWEAFGFTTVVENDLSASHVLETLENFALKDHSEFDAFVCCILSHGDSNVLFASDGEKISISTLIEIMCNKCTTLNDKPKLFFIQACQGTNVLVENGMINLEKGDSPKPITDINSRLSKQNTNPLDVYAVVSTINGFVSFRSPKDGSIFIKSLCNVMLKHGHKDSILDVITHVTDQVAKTQVNLGLEDSRKAKQIVPAYSTLRKCLILKKKNLNF